MHCKGQARNKKEALGDLRGEVEVAQVAPSWDKQNWGGGGETTISFEKASGGGGSEGYWGEGVIGVCGRRSKEKWGTVT